MGHILIWHTMAYHNTPRSLIGEKTFLLFGFYCHHPTEVATLPTKPLNATEITDYREELVLNLSSVRILLNQSS